MCCFNTIACFMEEKTLGVETYIVILHLKKQSNNHFRR